MDNNYVMLEVDQDYVWMSKFIETKLGCQFEDRKVFHEVTENEKLGFLILQENFTPQNETGANTLILSIYPLPLGQADKHL